MKQKRKNLKICGQQVNKKKKSFFPMLSFCCLENSIRGLDEDETGFLARIDQAKIEKQRELKRMEQEEIEELKISFFSYLRYYFFSFES
jgi:hypothetical protein